MNKKFIISSSLIAFLFLICLFCILRNADLTTTYGNARYETINIISKIDGILEELNFEKDSQVNKGEILAQIKQDTYQIEYEKALSELKKAQKDLEESNTKIKFISSQAHNNIKDAKQKLENANNDYVIYKNSFKDGTVTKKDLDKAAKNLQLAKENYENVQKNLQLAKETIENNKNLSDSQNEKIKNLTKKLEEAQLNLSYTTFIAPADGNIKELSVDIKDEVKTNQKIMSILAKDCFIETKLNNKQIKKVKINQEVIIHLNPYKHIKGKIENIEENSVFIKPLANCNLKNNKKVLIKIKTK